MSTDLKSSIDDFGRRFDGPPDGVWIAPGRVNIIGEHTDYSGGFVLPVAIDRHAAVSARARPDRMLRVSSAQTGDAPEVALDELVPGPMAGWWSYAHGVAWALGESGVAVTGADLVIDSAVPPGAGLSSSAALEVAVGLALTELSGAELSPGELALAAQRAEREWTGTPCGVMDQMAATAARAGHALLLDARSLVVEQIPFDLVGGGWAIVVIDTRVRHTHAGGEYADRARECLRAAEVLGVPALRDATPAMVESAAPALGQLLHRRARHVVTENARVLETAALLRDGRLGDLGPLLAASHQSLKSDFEVSTPELDTAVGAALSGGAAAARMTGGGFGGAAIALVETDAVPSVQRAVRAAFAAAGFEPHETFVVGTSDGARRLG